MPRPISAYHIKFSAQKSTIKKTCLLHFPPHTFCIIFTPIWEVQKIVLLDKLANRQLGTHTTCVFENINSAFWKRSQSTDFDLLNKIGKKKNDSKNNDSKNLWNKLSIKKILSKLALFSYSSLSACIRMCIERIESQ